MNISALRKTAAAALLFGLALVNLSCSGGGTPPAPVGTTSGHAYVFIADAPPPGTTILTFEITLSDATLCPTVSATGECQGSPQVSLLSAPVDIELSQLQLQPAFLSLKSIEARTYAGVKLTFANPVLKFLAADGSVQVLEAPTTLPLSLATVTPTFASALSVTADSNVGFLVDFNLRDSIQSSGTTITGISPVVTLVKLSATSQQTIEELKDTSGKVSNLTKTCPTGSFTLTDSLTGLALANIGFDSTTDLEGLSCDTLANDQIVEADVELRLPAAQTAEFFAKGIELVNSPGGETMQGVVVQVNSATEFVLLVQQEENLSSVPNGSFVTVTADPTNVQFAIDAGNLSVGSLTFATGADLLAGQTLEVNVTSGSMVVAPTGCATIADNCTASADTLTLKKGTFTAQVTATSDPNFTLGTLPSLFGTASGVFRPLSADCQSCAITSVQVTTSSATEFADELTGVSGLVVNDTVTVRGLLLKNSFTGPGPISPSFPPLLVAGRVRRQTS
jgi:hypothetical protein